MLKTKSPGTQLLIVISIALASFFILGIIGTMILAMISDMSVMDMADMSKWDFSKPGVVSAIRGMQVIQFISLFVIPTWLCAWLFSTDTKEYLGLRKPWPAIFYLVAILAMVISIPFVNWMGEVNRLVHFPPGIESWMKKQEEEAMLTIQALLSRHTVKDLLLNLFFIAALAAVGEELLFRGLLQRILIKLFRSPWLGIIVAALLFSAMHLQFYGFIPRFLLGIVLGLIYWYSGSLWASILAHFIYDAFIIVLVYFYPEMLKDETTVQLQNMAFMGIISLAATIALVIWMKRKSRITYQGVYAHDSVPVKDHPF